MPFQPDAVQGYCPRMDADQRLIPARSRREVMDWGLVLASQNIDAAVNRSEEGWGLLVEESDFDRARAVLRQYQEENRCWGWKRQLPGSDLVFHSGALIWVVVMGAFYYWTMTAQPSIPAAGMMEPALVLAGQWWRLFTAITMHENLPHLAANLLAGGLLLGLVMARYGPGVSMLAAFLAGAAGNCADLLVYRSTDQSLGASGMVMAALGMLSVHSFSFWRKFPGARHLMARGAAAGFLILVLTGFAPGVDMVAHVGGFFAGAIFGLALNALPGSVVEGAPANAASALTLAALIIFSWRAALSNAP